MSAIPDLERRLTAMPIVGLVEAHREVGRATPYRPSHWLRRAVGTLSWASAWEQDHIPEMTAPIGRADVESAFLLAVPLMELPAGLSGKVRLVSRQMTATHLCPPASLSAWRTARSLRAPRGSTETQLPGSPVRLDHGPGG